MDAFDLHPDLTTLLVVDVQERFQGAIPGIAPEAPVGRALDRLAAGCALLGVPALITEQYPKGLGHTLPHLRERLPGAAVVAKTHFSVLDDPALKVRFAEDPRTHVVLCGVEAHVCVLSTVADLIAHGKWVVVAADAVASRDPAHRDLALQAARDLGALVLPVESILFRLQRQAGGEVFKAISALVK